MDDKKDLWCFVCGKKCEPVPTGQYVTTTGEPEHKLQCPSGQCGHLGVKHAAPVASKGLFSFMNGRMHCPRCGEITHVDP